MSNQPLTLYEKIWADHVVERRDDGTCLIYIDRHLVHEVTSPQAFAGLRANGRTVRRPDLTLAVPDHNLPTTPRRDANGARLPIADPESLQQLDALERNTRDFGIDYIDAIAAAQGIVHVVGPEQGFTLPGTTLVCGDSHTSAHGALGALAFGIGTSEVEHVLATQTLLLGQSKTMEVRVDGKLGFGVSAKDVALAIIGKLGAAGGTGYVLEYTGSTIREMSIEGRLTIANMSIEAGARAGLVAPDETTFAYLKGRPMAPKGADWDAAVAYWRTLPSDPGAVYDAVVTIDATEIAPLLTWTADSVLAYASVYDRQTQLIDGVQIETLGSSGFTNDYAGARVDAQGDSAHIRFELASGYGYASSNRGLHFTLDWPETLPQPVDTVLVP